MSKRIVAGEDYPILVCMHCGGELRQAEGGYRCVDCDEPATLEEAGLEDIEITSIEEPKRGKKR